MNRAHWLERFTFICCFQFRRHAFCFITVTYTKGGTPLHPDKGPESGGTTLINALTFSFLTVIAGATLYFHTGLQGRFRTLSPENLSAPFAILMRPALRLLLPSTALFHKRDFLSDGFLCVLILFVATFFLRKIIFPFPPDSGTDGYFTLSPASGIVP